MSKPESIEPLTPQHIAIIMDGNGRWAKQRGLKRIQGHEAGAESIRAAVRGCREAGVKYLTLFAFSVENWVRPKDEIKGLFKLLETYLRKNQHELHENEIRLRIIGRTKDLPKAAQIGLDKVQRDTAKYDQGVLTLALSYGGRAEIVDAAREMAKLAAKGMLKPKDITEESFRDFLYAPDIPDPDLMIRTSGEVRISNFLLWQLSYAELYFTDVFWPDFREDELKKALEAYRQRHRRFGDVE